MQTVSQTPLESETDQLAAPVKITAVLVMSTLVAALGGLLFGFDTAVIAGTTHALTQVFHLSPATLGVTVSCALWGTIIGAGLAGYVGERFGRRDSLRVMAVLYLLSAIGCALAWNWHAFLASRIIVGLFQVNIVVGILMAYLSNYLVSLQNLGASEWRWQLVVPALPSVIFLLLLFVIPRSPRWLIKKNRFHEAKDALAMTGENDPDLELACITKSIGAESCLSGERLFSYEHRLPIFLAITIAIFSQLSGINAVLYYLNDIFQSVGISGGIQTVAIGATNLVFTALALLVIDKLGRRLLLLTGSIGMTATLSGVAVIFYTHAHRELLVWLLITYCASFSFSLGAVIWVYISEVFPNAVRAKGQALGSLTHWAMNAIVSAAFPVLAARAGSAPFTFFAAMMMVQFFVVLFIYPETKRVSLEVMRLKIAK